MVNFGRILLKPLVKAGQNVLKNNINLEKIKLYRDLSLNTFLRMAESGLLKPPPEVQGMTHLNKECFQKVIRVPCLLSQHIEVSKVLKHIKKFLLRIEHFKPVQHKDHTTLFYLNPTVIKAWTDLPNDVRQSLEELSVNSDNLMEKDLTLKYENYSADDILKAVLPSDKEGCSSYTRTGHIVHVNLREHLLPYKTLIGKVLHDKVNGCRSVVNKIDNIENTYRNFKMEVLCGESDTVVRLKENRCTFEFDFSTVYWNSRLSTEHERIINMLKPNNVLFDVFAGVGPFSIPAAKKKCIVFANDLNPESYKWLHHNQKINKINDDFLKIYNKDGRDFIRNEVRNLLPKYMSEHNVYVTMNLPALAVDFLNAFVGLLEGIDVEVKNPPILFVYCFAKGEDYVNITKQKIIDGFGFDVTDHIVDIFRVRTVSSLKEMMRVQIKLDSDILKERHVTKRKLEEADSPLSKKCNYGEKQEENEQCIQGSRSQELETESESKSSKN